MLIGHFLAGIAAVIWDTHTGRYLLLRRAAHRDYGQGAWESVTGRVDQGESFEQAVHREVREEIAAEVQIEFIIATTHFYRGEEKPENELLGLIYGCTIKDAQAVTMGDEHSEMRWVTVEEALAFLPQSHWLRNVIQRAELLKAHLPAELRHVFRQEGFNIG
ncbi:MAG: NUDIX domain-containing protein [Chloroflexota bacterium]